MKSMKKTKTGRGVGGSMGNKSVINNKNTMAPKSRPVSNIGTNKNSAGGMSSIKDTTFPSIG